MWQPAGGSDPRLDELMVRVAAMHAAIRELNKHAEYLDAHLYETIKRLEGGRPWQEPSPS